MRKETEAKPTRAVVAAVQLPGVSDIEFELSVSELRGLGKTLGFQVVGTFTQKRANFDTTAYLGVGKRQEMRRFVEGEVEADAAAAPASTQKAATSAAARAKEAPHPPAPPPTRPAAALPV